jgi:plastocyanin
MRTRRLATSLAVIALAAFAFGACGDDEEEPAVTPAPTAEEGAGGGETVDVAADPGGALAFEQKTLQAPAGAVSFQLENQASVPHDFCIERDGQEVGCSDEITESSTTLDVDLEAGEYAFYCSVPGHRAAGMEGTLTVN